MPPVIPVLPANPAPASGAVVSALPAAAAPASGAVVSALSGSGPPAAGTVTAVPPAAGVPASGTVNPALAATAVAPGGAVTPVPTGPASVPAPVPSDAVRHSPQSLTDEQKDQVLANIESLNLRIEGVEGDPQANGIYQMRVWENNPYDDERVWPQPNGYALSRHNLTGAWSIRNPEVMTVAFGIPTTGSPIDPWDERVAWADQSVPSAEVYAFEASNLVTDALVFLAYLSGNAPAARYVMDVPGNQDAMLLSENQTAAGEKTFANQVFLIGQTAANPSSAMNRNLVAEAFGMMPGVHTMIPFSTGTVTGTGSAVGAPSRDSVLLTIANTADASARVKISDDFGYGDANAGLTFGFAMPFIFRVPVAFSQIDPSGIFRLRVYCVTQGTMALPAAGVHPYPANTRGFCAEIRQKSSGTGFEARLCSRDGTAAAAGTPAETAWVSISDSNNTKHIDLAISSNGSGTARLFATVYAMSTGDCPPTWQSLQVGTLTGAGVPSTNAAVATFWSRPEVAIIGDGSATPGATRYFKVGICTAVYGVSL